MVLIARVNQVVNVGLVHVLIPVPVWHARLLHVSPTQRVRMAVVWILIRLLSVHCAIQTETVLMTGNAM